MGLRSSGSNPAMGAAQGAAAGSMAGPYGALIGAGVGAGMSLWDMMEKSQQRGPAMQAYTNDLLRQQLFGAKADPLTAQRVGESLAPSNFMSNTLAGAGGGYQFGQNLDDYRFKQKMRQENPWAYLRATEGTV